MHHDHTCERISPNLTRTQSSRPIGVRPPACPLPAIVSCHLQRLHCCIRHQGRKVAIARGPRMQMFSMFSNKPDPATNLAKTPALDKTKSDEEWAAILNPTTFKVLRRKATEPRGVTVSRGGWDNHFEKGTYVCSGCKTPLYTSEHKFDCGACAR